MTGVRPPQPGGWGGAGGFITRIGPAGSAPRDRRGTVVDATLIAAPSSTKNQSGERDPQMKQSKKGQQWYFGKKYHIGADAESELVHTVRGTTGSVGDMVEANSLLGTSRNPVWAAAAV